MLLAKAGADLKVKNNVRILSPPISFEARLASQPHVGYVYQLHETPADLAHRHGYHHLRKELKYVRIASSLSHYKL